MRLLILCCIFATLVGCSGVQENSVTDLREYSVDGYLYFVGVGTWDNDTFVITDYRGVKHDIPSGATILEGPISLSSFDRARQRIITQDSQ